MDKKVKLNVRVERELLEAFKLAARNAGSNASAVMRERIHAFLNMSEADKSIFLAGLPRRMRKSA